MAATVSDPQTRERVIGLIRDELRKVDGALEAYVPEALILEGSSLTVRIALDEATTVHADFKHLA